MPKYKKFNYSSINFLIINVIWMLNTLMSNWIYSSNTKFYTHCQNFNKQCPPPQLKCYNPVKVPNVFTRWAYDTNPIHLTGGNKQNANSKSFCNMREEIQWIINNKMCSIYYCVHNLFFYLFIMVWAWYFRVKYQMTKNEMKYENGKLNLYDTLWMQLKFQTYL